MAIWVQVQKADGMISGMSRGGTVPTVDPAADHEVHEVDAATALAINDAGFVWPGTNELRWQWTGSAAVEVSDARALVEFTPAIVADRIGQADEVVSVRVVDPETGQTMTGVNNVFSLVASNDRNFRVAVQIQNGVGSITVTKGERKYLVFEDQHGVRFVAPLVIDIEPLNTL